MTVAAEVQYEETSPFSPANGPLFRTLVDYYMEEMTPYVAAGYRVERDPQGVWLDRYWTEAKAPTSAWIFRHRGAAAGFAIAAAWPNCLHIAEFCVARGHRRMGVGTAAVNILKGHVQGGRYPALVAQIYESNAPALAFWQAQEFRFVQPSASPPWPPHLGVWGWPAERFNVPAEPAG